MNIHEYQAKNILKGFGAPIADGIGIIIRGSSPSFRQAYLSCVGSKKPNSRWWAW